MQVPNSTICMLMAGASKDSVVQLVHTSPHGSKEHGKVLKARLVKLDAHLLAFALERNNGLGRRAFGFAFAFACFGTTLSRTFHSSCQERLKCLLVFVAASLRVDPIFLGNATIITGPIDAANLGRLMQLARLEIT